METALLFSPDRFREVLKTSEVTRAELARSFGYNGKRSVHNLQTNIRWYAEGRRTPTPETVEKLAAGLGVPVEDLCDEVEWDHRPDAAKVRRLAVLLFSPDTDRAGV